MEICLACWGHSKNASPADVEYAEVREAMGEVSEKIQLLLLVKGKYPLEGFGSQRNILWLI